METKKTTKWKQRGRKMKFDKFKFIAIMKANGDTYQKLADAMGINVATLSNKVNSAKVRNGEYTTKFNDDNIKFITHRYAMSKEQIIDVFYGDLV